MGLPDNRGREDYDSGRRYAALIGDVELAIDHLDANVQMIIGHDMRDFRRHRLNNGIEVELSRQQSGNIQIVVEQPLGARVRPSVSPPNANCS